jgi:hypothetical protein
MPVLCPATHGELGTDTAAQYDAPADSQSPTTIQRRTFPWRLYSPSGGSGDPTRQRLPTGGVFNGDLGNITKIDLEEQEAIAQFAEREVSDDYADLSTFIQRFWETVRGNPASDWLQSQKSFVNALSPLPNEPSANHCFATLDALELVQAEHCRWTQTQPSLVRSYTRFRWWSTPLYST